MNQDALAMFRALSKAQEEALGSKHGIGGIAKKTQQFKHTGTTQLQVAYKQSPLNITCSITIQAEWCWHRDHPQKKYPAIGHIRTSLPPPGRDQTLAVFGALKATARSVKAK